MLPADAFDLPEIIIPTTSIIQACEAMVQPLFKQQEQLFEQSRTLTQTRDLLLPKLMSGEIRLREAEKAVEVVT